MRAAMPLFSLGMMTAFCQDLSQPSETTLRFLNSTIPHVAFTSSAEGFGGATVEDVVVTLRQLVKFPICMELKEFRSDVDGLTLGAAIAELTALKAKRGLEPPDESRLKRYEELASTQSRSTLIGFRKKTFTLVQDNITVAALLDRVTELDRTYRWRNEGTDSVPLVVIQPRQQSALEWPVPPLCGSTAMPSSSLYGPNGQLTSFFSDHRISRVELNGGNRLPNVPLNLCFDHLTALKVLNLTIIAAGNGTSWSLSGVQGLRWLTFQSR
jgi:hypothetical protein